MIQSQACDFELVIQGLTFQSQPLTNLWYEIRMLSNTFKIVLVSHLMFIHHAYFIFIYFFHIVFISISIIHILGKLFGSFALQGNSERTRYRHGWSASRLNVFDNLHPCSNYSGKCIIDLISCLGPGQPLPGKHRHVDCRVALVSVFSMYSCAGVCIMCLFLYLCRGISKYFVV